MSTSTKSTTQPTKASATKEQDPEIVFEDILVQITKSGQDLTNQDLRTLLNDFAADMTEGQMIRLLRNMRAGVLHDSKIASGFAKDDFRLDLLQIYLHEFPAPSAQKSTLWAHVVDPSGRQSWAEMQADAEMQEEEERAAAVASTTFDSFDDVSISHGFKQLQVTQHVAQPVRDARPFCRKCSQGIKCDNDDTSFKHAVATKPCKHEKNDVLCENPACTYKHIEKGRSKRLFKASLPSLPSAPRRLDFRPDVKINVEKVGSKPSSAASSRAPSPVHPVENTKMCRTCRKNFIQKEEHHNRCIACVRKETPCRNGSGCKVYNCGFGH